ncbi:hypothetical protein [Mycoplasma phocoeninasale]|uniref:S1 motif domain-containing protein n=1 Tax=Mycoplasma phocoeninasale TaxID=2726117 RepID=A0A858U684_9MOLU|nr:hypothetical protein [Mycoplasma phocoeninasale]MBN0970584.1 hypothetical protein [Mycoplasma phocoeninasale]QJG66298.1 hypothetical protein HGG64_01040 [Mycoplasma phocoeninasale]
MNDDIEKIIRAKVTKVWKNTVNLVTKNNVRCFLNINEVSDYYVNNLNLLFEVGQIREVQIIDVMPTGEYLVSFKRIHPRMLRNPFSFKLEKNDPKFKNLLDFTNKGINYGK